MTSVVAHTDPYPWPYAGLPSPDRVAVIVAGADAHWIGRCPPSAALATAARITALTGPLRELGATVIHVEHERPPRAPAVGPPPAPPASIREPDDLIVTAGGIDAFFGSPLDRRLRSRGCDHLLVCGFGLEGPVHSTMRSANDQGYECLLVTDAAAPLDEDAVAASLSMVTMSGGIFGALGTSTDVLAAFAISPPFDSPDPLAPLAS